MGYAAVARGTKAHWIAASVLDNIKFGLPAGGELKTDISICNETQASNEMVVNDQSPPID
jgi:hypothetical protein